MRKQILLLMMMMLPMMAGAFVGEAVVDGINYQIITKARTAEVRKLPEGKYVGVVVIPETIVYEGVECSVTGIGDQAFRDCSELASVVIPNSVTKIGNEAFQSCKSLILAYLPDGLTSIGDWAFSGCSGLTSLNIPNSVTAIGNYALEYCSGLASMTIPNGVTSIGEATFQSCSGLNSVTIHDGVTTIGDLAFSGCSGLTEVTIPDGVTIIGNYTFRDCSGLKSVTIGSGVTSIGAGAFDNCSGLDAVTIPENVTSIVSEAFRGCSGLTTVIIPNGVTVIGTRAFKDCSSLTAVTIGSSARTIGEQTFANCPELADVYCLAEQMPSTKSNAFEGSYIEYATLHVPATAYYSYKSSAPWMNFKNIVTLNGEEPVEPVVRKCERPTISYVDGQLSFDCATEDVGYVTDITDADIKRHYEATVSLTATYHISVYATKQGYENSDVASATLCWIDQEPAKEGVDNVAEILARAILIKSEGGRLTVEGANDHQTVSVYGADGTLVGQGISRRGVVTIGTNLPDGSVAVVRIGDKAVKVVVR